MTRTEQLEALNAIGRISDETGTGCNQPPGWFGDLRSCGIEDPDEALRWLREVGVLTWKTPNHLAVDWRAWARELIGLPVEVRHVSLYSRNVVNVPYFPPIVEDGSVCRFDWVDFDSELERRHDIWRKRTNRDDPYRKALPDEYERMVAAMRFELPHGYREEIERNMAQCQREWTVDRPFDTTVRGDCLKPAQEHARVAFRLAYDMLRSSNRNSALSVVLERAALYKFWFHQTGAGVAWNNSGLGKLPENFWVGCDPKRKVETERLVGDLDAYRKQGFKTAQVTKEEAR